MLSKKRSFPRIISLALTLSMLFTFLPINILKIAALEPGQILIDFSQTTTGSFADQTPKWQIVTSPGYTVNEDQSKAGVNRRMFTLPTGEKYLQTDCYGSNHKIWPTDTTMNVRFTITVSVPAGAAANYAMSFQGAKSYTGIVSSIYVDDIYMGDYSFYNGETDSTVPMSLGEVKRLNSIYLDEGEHNISFRTRSNTITYGSIAYIYLYKIFLDPAAEAPELESVDANMPDTLTLGQDSALSARAMMSDTMPYNFGLKGDGTTDTENTITVTSSNTNVAAVSNVQTVVPGGGDTTTATLTPVALGTTTITTTATIGGVTKTSSKTVTVKSNAEYFLSSASLSLTGYELHNGETAIAKVTGAQMSDNTAADLAGSVIIYMSSNPEIASVNALTGIITAVSQGTAQIYALVTLAGGGVTVTSESKTVTILGDMPLNGKRYVVDLTLCKSKYTDSDIRPITIDDTTTAITANMKNYIPWGFAGYDTNIIPANPSNPPSMYLSNRQAYGIQMWTNKTAQWVSLKFKIPKEGKYYTLLNHARSGAGCIGNVYLAPWTEDGDTAEWRNSSYLIGTVDYYNKSTISGIVTGLNAINIKTAGDYVLTFEVKQKSGFYYMYPGAFTLIGFVFMDNFDFNFNKDKLGYSETDTVSLSGKLNDGTDIDFSKASITYTSSDLKIAEIDSTGKITAKRAIGDTDITVTATLDGITKTVTKTLHVIDKEPLTITAEEIEIPVGETSKIISKILLLDGSEADLTNVPKAFYTSDKNVLAVDQNGNLTTKGEGVAVIREEMNYGEYNDIKIAQITITVTDNSTLDTVSLAGSGQIGVQRDEKLKLSGKMTSGYAAYLQNATVNYEIASCEPAGAVTISQDGTIYGVTLGGTATVKATVTLRGVTRETNPYSVTVAEPDAKDVIINFRKDQIGKPINATIETHGWQINISKSAAEAKSAAYSTGYEPYASYGIYSPIVNINSAVTSDTVFDVNIPYTGYYRFTFAGTRASSGAEAALFIDDIYVGEYNFYNASTKIHPTVGMRSIPLSAGIHTVTVRSMSKPGKGCRQYFNCLNFWGINTLPAFDSFALNLTKDELVRGETATLNARIRLEDGFEFAADPMSTGDADPYTSITMESSDPNVFTIDSNGIITGVGAGTANVELTAVYNGNTYTKEIPVTVSGNTLGSVEFDTDRRVFYVGETFDLTATAKLDNQSEMTGNDTVISFTSSAPEILSISNNTLTAKAAGTAQITATAVLGGTTITNTIDVEVKPDTFGKVIIDADNLYMKLNSEGIQLRVSGKTYAGQNVDLTGAVIEYSSRNPEIAEVNSTGRVTPKATGTAEIVAAVTKDGVIASGSAEVTVREGKIESTIYTPEKVAAARENIEKYSWAKKLKDAAMKKADKYVGKEEMLWNMVTAEGLPRGAQVGFMNDPNLSICRYCGGDLRAAYGLNSEWYINPLDNPWKVKCRLCGRSFPSNDFGSFYKLGLDEHGIFNRELAKTRNQELIEKGAKDEKGYLTNVLYPEKGEGWGVDDGFGYDTGDVYSNGIKEVHTYIACYLHWGIWYPSNPNNYPGIICSALDSLREAYLYTGDMKYGRVGAILTDRVADVYPDFDLYLYNSTNTYWNSHGGTNNGKIIGCQWESVLSRRFSLAYDSFFPAMKDPYVVKFLKTKAKKYKLDNDKSTPEKIYENCEYGILHSIYTGCKNGKITGASGAHQVTLATAAVVMDFLPDTEEWLEWLFRKSIAYSTSNTGGGLFERLIDNLSRDGFGDQGAVGYNNLWLGSMINVAEVLNGCKTYPSADLYKNPKFVKMFTAIPSIMLAQKAAPQIGDSGSTADYNLLMKLDNYLLGYQRIRNPKLAQLVYWLNGNSANGIHGDIFTKNPEQLATDIQTVINKHGEYDWTRSEMLPEHGFAILRAGNDYQSEGVNATLDNQRDFWLFFGGGATSHLHADGLNLGIEAYGINFAPDLGYPETTGTDPNRHQWVNNTLSHNTVVVNEKRQIRPLVAGNPLHFDSADRVKLMDINMPDVYAETDIYRRTMVMVEYDSDISYGVDFFRILGGDDHLYSFHAASEEVYETEGLDLIAQVGGSYAGVDVPWGKDPYTDETNNKLPLKYPQGYTWLQEVRKAENPETGKFAVDFKIKDFGNMLPYPMDLHLRMTMLNDFNLNEVSLAAGMPPAVAGNSMINKLQYVLARRSGKNLDTLYTTVYEPYCDSRYVASLDSVPVVKLEGDVSSKDKVKAVKVTLLNGRVDYVVYATNNQVKYRVDNQFEFRGFIGVYTMKNGSPIYTYLNDGDIIGESENNTATYTGKVLDFTKELAFDNSISVQFNSEVELEKLAGRCINIANDGERNAVYQVESAVAEGGNKVQLNLGNNTLIRSYKDANDIYGGYIYNIAEGQSFRIPLSIEEDNSPVFQNVIPRIVDANSEISFIVSAVSPIGKTLVYNAVQLPRGATFDKDTQRFFWVPDSKQVGDNIAVIRASDGDMESTAYYTIKVLTATFGADRKTSGNTSGGETSGGSVDSGLSGGGTSGGIIPPVTATEKFMDLAGYDWAKEAIDELAANGIINGTSDTTYSPQLNITRADFAILLVRALGLKSDSTDNFSDVPGGAYYANELATAKGSGIITGVGGNRFNPTAQISRQDMMVIVVRAMKKAGYALEAGSDDDLAGFSDAGQVAGYANDAVATLVKNGIIKGANGMIHPKGNTIRAEAAVLIQRIFKQ